MSDSLALFHATHVNLNSGGAASPSQTSIQAMVEAMMVQKGIGDDGAKTTVGSPPIFFLAKPTIAFDIDAIIKAVFRETGTSESQSMHAPQTGLIAVANAVAVAQLQLQATTDWYGVSDQGLSPRYEVAFLNRNQNPRTKIVVGGTVDGTTVVVDLDFAIFPTGGWQGINRNAGA